MIITRVQWLVYVADEVQEKLEGETFLLLARRGSGQFCGEFIDFIDHAVIGGAEGSRGVFGQRRSAKTRGLQIRTFQFQIHEMPIARLVVMNLRRVAIGVTEFVRPSRLLDYLRT